MTTVGDGVALALVEEGDAVVVENPGGTVEERAEVAEVGDEVVVGLEVVLSTAILDESEGVNGLGAEFGGTESQAGVLVDVRVGVGDDVSVSEGSDGDEDTGEFVGSIVELPVDVPSSWGFGGAPVPSQYKLTALGPPHICDASPVHAMLHESSGICSARSFSRLPQKHSPVYSVPARP